MTPDRWEQINRIYDAALEVAEAERPVFVREVCQGDEDLRREVESLLAYDKPARQFIDRPAMQMAAEKLAGEPASLVGRKLGPYQVQVLLGSGGMGDVYRARDTRLNRIVAIKVLPRHLLERADLRQRFEREARAIASLDHPHVCALYDIGQEGTTDFLVMQYLDGETLSQRLRKGPLPTAEVMRYAIEIAGALEQAHRKGVVHRDLKPGNIMLTETGAKLLDFGLAKQKAPVLRTGATSVDAALRAASGLATKSESLTEEGMILGTLEYMAPEQLEGKEADARTDLFALGVVIYEMATGQKAFQGDSKASLIAKILTFQPPPIKTIQPVSPPELDQLVQKCLAKKPEERWQSAAELRSQLQEIAESNLENLKAQKRGREPSREAKGIEPRAEPAVPVALPFPRRVLSSLIRSRAWKLTFVGIVLAVITGSVALWQVRRQPERPADKPDSSFKALTSYTGDNPLDSAAISPDGKLLAFCSRGKLFRQVVHSGEKYSLALPQGFYPSRVSWFPDGTKLLLGRAEETWIQVEGQTKWQSDLSLWSLSFLGGTPRNIVDHTFYPTISPDGSLIAFVRFDPDRQAHDLWLVGSNGEEPRKLRTASQAERTASSTGGPSFSGGAWSPNGKRVMYRRVDNKGVSRESCDLNGENITRISSSIIAMAPPIWTADGRYIIPGTETELGLPATNVNLWEMKIDSVTGQALGKVRRLTQWPAFSFGNVGDLSTTADGKRLVLLKSNAQSDVYVAEVEPGGKAMKTPRPLTMDLTDDAVWGWTADSRSILFESHRNGNRDLFKQDINQREAEAIVHTPEHEWHPSLSPDGTLVMYLVSEKPGQDATRLMRILLGGGPPEPVLTGERIRNFSCAREANVCVVAEAVAGKQVLTTFHPLKGRGERLPQSDYPDFGRGILSPQGRLIEKMKQGPEGLHIRVRSLTGDPVEEITFKNLTKEYSFMGWSLNGKGIYLSEWPLPADSHFTAFYAGLDGHSQVLWKRGMSPGHSFDYPIPSPDGRYLAFTVVTYESNAWMLENF